MTATQEQLLDLDFYLQKTYCKTASLMANSAKSIAVLAGESREVRSSLQWAGYLLCMLEAMCGCIGMCAPPPVLN